MFGDDSNSAGIRCTSKKKSLKLSREITYNENECNAAVEVRENSLNGTEITVDNKVYGVSVCYNKNYKAVCI